MRKAVVMCSGGVDSVTALYYVAKIIRANPILVINADYGQRMVKEERWCVKKAVEDLEKQGFKSSYKEIDISWMKELSTSLLVQENVPVPETPQEDIWDEEKAKNRILRWWDVVRNTMLLTIGLAHAEHFDLDSYIKTKERDIYDVYIGIRREGPVAMKDNTPEFVAEMNRLVEHATHFGGYKISAPLLERRQRRRGRTRKSVGRKLPLHLQLLSRMGLDRQRRTRSLRILQQLPTKKRSVCARRNKGSK